MAQQVKIISEKTLQKAEKQATKLVADGWAVKGATTALIQRCFYSNLEFIIVLEK
ncbi:MAG: hypothetical protein ACLFR1_12065 [Spirochaetia bacterium]